MLPGLFVVMAKAWQMWYNNSYTILSERVVSMQLFELVSPKLFRPLAGPNRAYYAELLLLLWEECRHTADYSLSRAEAVSRAEDYFAAVAKPLALDADGAGDEDEQKRILNAVRALVD